MFLVTFFFAKAREVSLKFERLLKFPKFFLRNISAGIQNEIFGIYPDMVSLDGSAPDKNYKKKLFLKQTNNNRKKS